MRFISHLFFSVTRNFEIQPSVYDDVLGAQSDWETLRLAAVRSLKAILFIQHSNNNDNHPEKVR